MHRKEHSFFHVLSTEIICHTCFCIAMLSLLAFSFMLHWCLCNVPAFFLSGLPMSVVVMHGFVPNRDVKTIRAHY